MKLGINLGISSSKPQSTVITQAVAILRRFGSDAHVYLPGIGTLSGLSAANFLDSALTTPATVDNPVGGAVDAIGVINATQPTTAAKPILRQTAGKYSWAFDGGDSLSLGSVPFQMSDDFFVIAGCINASATGSQTLYSQASTAAANPLLLLDVTSGYPRLVCRDDAAAISAPTGASIVSNTVATISGRKTGNTKVCRVNGVQASTDSTIVGATTFTGAAIGVRPVATPTGFFTGSTGPIIAGKGTLTDSEMLTLERFVAQLTPNAPVF